MSTEKASIVYNRLLQKFPDAKCELDYTNMYELIVAVILSAQTTDKRVNIVTKDLFKKYPDVYSLANASFNDVASVIASLGLYKNKTEHIISMAKKVVSDYNGEIPSDFDSLVSLPGVGRKTANVVLSEGFKIPAIAVDTHVSRVSQRIGLTTNTDPYLIEMDLQKQFDKKDWHLTHHLLILTGRYICIARKPLCEQCPLTDICNYYKMTKTTTNK